MSNNTPKPTTCSSSSLESGTSKGDNDDVTSIARRETRVIRILRIAVMSVLLMTTVLGSTGINVYTHNQDLEKFVSNFEENAIQVIESFHMLVEQHLEAAAWMSTLLTSHTIQANQSFPFVTLPDFHLHGSHFRSLSGSHVVHYMPLISNENRAAWEEYAMDNRFHIDDAFQQDAVHRRWQDQELGKQSDRSLQQQSPGGLNMTIPGGLNMTILDDETGYHPRIWRNEAVEAPGDEPEGNGPFLPLWQRSPIEAGRQGTLNMNFVKTKALRRGIVDLMVHEKKAVLNSAAVPIPKTLEFMKANLKLSQYRESVEEYVDGLSTFLAYPVFDSFQEGTREVAGVLATNIYWKILFTSLIPSLSKGIICVVENSFNQSFAYQIDGDQAHFLGMGDPHDQKYDDLHVSTDIIDYLQKRASPQTRAYATVPLSAGAKYIMRVYPAQEMEDQYLTNAPIVYTAIAICCFTSASILCLAFSWLVERRQSVMIEKVLENAKKAFTAEREMNEFLSHEVRNPLSAALSACSFVSAALNEPDPLSNAETRRLVREDIEVVNSSIHYINDFLKSLLDIHRAVGSQMTIEKSPANLLRDIFQRQQSCTRELPAFRS